MNSRPLTILGIAALLSVPTVAVAKGGDDDRGRDDKSGKRDQRYGSGTVSSYAGGRLTITLSNGETVTARVTRRTEIECSSASQKATRSKRGDDDAPGDDSRGRGRGSDDSPSPSPTSSPEPSPTSSPSPSPKPTPGARRCGRAQLVEGAKVRKSRVRAGTFKKVQLFR